MGIAGPHACLEKLEKETRLRVVVLQMLKLVVLELEIVTNMMY